MTDLNDTADAKTIFAPLWKRKWLILIVGLLAGALTYAYYKQQDPVYGAATGIYLGSGSEVQELLGEVGSPTGNDRSIANQVVLINSSVVAGAVQRKLLKEGDVEAARGSAVAESAEGRDFIQISTRAGSGAPQRPSPTPTPRPTFSCAKPTSARTSRLRSKAPASSCDRPKKAPR